MGCGQVETTDNEVKKDNPFNDNNNNNNNNDDYQTKSLSKNLNNKNNDKIPQKEINAQNELIKQKKKKERDQKKEKMKKEMKEYQKLIKRKRKFLNQNGEYESSEDSQDSRLKYAKGKNLGKKRKKLTPEEIEDGIKQDQKEEEKRKGRKAYFSPMQKEIPFKHKEPESPYDPNISKPYSLGYEDEIYKEINYGKPIRFYNQTWLTYDAPVEADIYGPRVMIPPGWRTPTLKDYKNLFKFIGNNEKIKIFLTHERLMNMKKDFLYITSDKVFPDDYNGYNTKAWAYFCIGFNFYDEVEYPGIEPLVLPNQQKKIINIAQDNKKDEENINTMNNNNNSKEEIKEEFEDAIVSDDDDDFIKKMNKQLNKNREDYGPLVADDIRRKNRLYILLLII